MRYLEAGERSPFALRAYLYDAVTAWREKPQSVLLGDASLDGVLLVNYTGHGSEEQWSFADLLDDTSVAAPTNGGRLPVFLLMDCLNGFFHDVYATSLSTSLLMAPNGGAVAVWASSGFTTAPPQASMDQALLRTLAANPSEPLGQAILTAKFNITDPDVAADMDSVR
jgi:hypothetical protein